MLAMNMDVPSVFRGAPLRSENPGWPPFNLADLACAEATNSKKLETRKSLASCGLQKLEPEQGRQPERQPRWRRCGDGRPSVLPKGPAAIRMCWGFAGMDDRGLERVELRYEQYLPRRKTEPWCCNRMPWVAQFSPKGVE